jgi:hypothetical protein
MIIEHCPPIGTPKQNAFACRLAGALKYARLADAVTDGLGLSRGAALPASIPAKPQASEIIAFLLARAKAEDVKVFFRRKGKAGKAEGGEGQHDAQRAEQNSAPAIETLPSDALVAELERRGIPAGLAVANPDVVGGAPALLEAAARAVLAAERDGSARFSATTAVALAALRNAIEDTGVSLPEAAREALAVAA